MADRIGLVHVYTGDGKGKTTAAIGLAVRAAGRGLNCRIIQFMKGATTSGETAALAAMETIHIDRIGLNLIGPNPPDTDEIKRSLIPAMEAARTAVGGQFDLVVLDEIITACSAGLLSEPSLISIIQEKAEAVELVLTGRGATEELIGRADYVTEMKNIKHPFDQGQPARIGIEF
ncbi:MAG: cob(I)yrinic acid a,c-diamide adenosyltransferase [Actinomycetota bacterium]|nr:cob(I)yrinic acid a,c-diamide adenosyltransferase [Actinomycetota bacterium]